MMWFYRFLVVCVHTPIYKAAYPARRLCVLILTSKDVRLGLKGDKVVLFPPFGEVLRQTMGVI